MARRPKSFSIRGYRDGDEEALARLFSSYFADFFGPSPVTGESWREQFRSQGWTGPSVEADNDCVRLAERGGELVGYAVTDYEPIWLSGGALVQELCVAEGAEASEIAEALIEDAEQRARDRGKSFIAVQLAEDDGMAASAAAACGYHVRPDPDQVFMAVVTDLSVFLAEIAGELSRRVSESEFGDWRGSVRLESGEDSSDLHIDNGTVEVRETAEEPDVSVRIEPEALPLLLMARQWPGDLYLEGSLSASASERADALRLLQVLFPRTPLYLPRAQWW